MSYSCPECHSVIYDRTNYACPTCGAELPPVMLFRPADMPDFDEIAEGHEAQMVLLAELLRDLRQAHGHSQAIREATIRYFTEGNAQGFDVSSLLEWLSSWPNRRWSVLSQAPDKARREFVELLQNGFKEVGRQGESP
jgi:hypothetical protein